MSFFKRHRIHDLQVASEKEKYGKRLMLTTIAIIDDEGLPETKIEGLKRRGYRIEELSDIEQIRQLDAYSIIISDVNGVATKLDEIDQGLGLIRLVSKHYPYKGLGVYSGKTHSLPTLPSDVIIIQKDDDLDKWSEKLDNLINSVSNPIDVWRRFAKRLIDEGISAHDLKLVEDKYVSSILKGKSPNSLTELKLSHAPNISGVIDSLVANGIFLGITKVLGL